VKPAAFVYARPSSLEEATALLTEQGGDAQILAGGQSLLPMLNLRLARPRVLVDIARLAELRTVGWDGDELRVGATTSQRDLECHGDVDRLPVLRSAIGHMGSVATRNFGTIGGAIALADPVAELPVSLVTLGGTVTARSERGVRQIAGRELYRSYYTTVLEPDEILTEVAFPALAPGQAAAFDEITVRHWGDPTLVVAMATATLTGGRCSQVDVGLGGVADTPLLVSAAAESVLGGVDPSDATLDAAAEAVADSLDPSSDVHASAAHRRRLARHLTRRVLEAAFTQVREEVPA
jgi:CO/xanthine dehydrogenase FAD-binding subunit